MSPHCFFPLLSYSSQSRRLAVCSVLYNIINADKKALQQGDEGRRRRRKRLTDGERKVFCSFHIDWLLDIGKKENESDVDMCFSWEWRFTHRFCFDNWTVWVVCWFRRTKKKKTNEVVEVDKKCWKRKTCGIQEELQAMSADRGVREKNICQKTVPICVITLTSISFALRINSRTNCNVMSATTYSLQSVRGFLPFFRAGAM